MKSVTSWRDEVGSQLGDRRLSDRHTRIVEALSRNPEASFPNALGSKAEVDAGYRFVTNKRVGLVSLLSGHRDNSVKRAAALGEAVAIHDTTEMGFSRREHHRAGLQRFSADRQGYFAHTSVLASADGLRCPLGCVAVHPFVRLGDWASEAEREFWNAQSDPMTSEVERWLRGVDEVEQVVDGQASLIHVTDREGDAYEILAGLVQKERRFVLRLTQPRLVESGDDRPVESLFNRLEVQPFLARREVVLSERLDAGRRPNDRKWHPSRRQREAVLAVRATTAVVRRPRTRTDLRHLPKGLELHLVDVQEIDCPAGEEPVRWTLATLEPIGTESELWRVVDLYRTRWLIEEFFKAIKTGCAYESRQFDSAASLLVALALFIPIAWNLLLMRHLDREAPQLPATSVLSDSMIAVLVALMPYWKWPKKITVRDAYRAIARLGGHLKRNGPPGWLTLARGFRQLLMAHEGWVAAQRMRCGES